jgi:aryl-alcohol dehydrogenase-like predicted oxidoreductase
MKTLDLPNSDVRISQAIFGTSRLGGTVQHYNKKDALALLERAADAGVSTFDTANIYAQGNSETLLGLALKKRRDQMIYATKGGYAFGGKSKLISLIKPLARKILGARPGLARAAGKVRGSQMAQDFSISGLTSALEGSLKRLKTDYIDIYQLHSPSEEVLKKGEVFEVLETFKKEGKIRASGVSLLSWDHLPYCFKHGISFVQLEADFLAGEGRARELGEAAEEGILVAARQSFGSGLLALPSSEWSIEQFKGDEDRMNTAKRRLEQVEKIGSPFEVILEHLMHGSGFPAFLFATTNLNHLESNLAALSQRRRGEEFTVDVGEIFNK